MRGVADRNKEDRGATPQIYDAYLAVTVVLRNTNSYTHICMHASKQAHHSIYTCVYV